MKIFFKVWSAMVLLGSDAMDAAACACCATAGTVYDRSVSRSSAEMEELRKLRLEGVWDVYSPGEAGETEARYKSYDAVGMVGLDAIDFELTEKGKPIGVVRFKLERDLDMSLRDLNYLMPEGSYRKLGRSDILLYKEIQNQGVLEPKGDVETKLGYALSRGGTLLLLGNGNACLDASDLKRWKMTYEAQKRGTYEPRSASGKLTVMSASDLARQENNLGMEAYREKNYEAAAVHFKKAIDLKPDYLLAHMNAACVYALTGDPASAVGRLQSAYELDPKKTVEKMRKDKDFDSLRQDKRFQLLLEGAGQ